MAGGVDGTGGRVGAAPTDLKGAWAAAWRPFAAWTEVPVIRREDLPLLYARTEQRAWLAGVEAYLGGARDDVPPDLPDSSACAWLHSEGHQRYCAQPAFKAVERQYQAVHALARQLCADYAAGETDAVNARLPELRAERDALLEQMKHQEKKYYSMEENSKHMLDWDHLQL